MNFHVFPRQSTEMQVMDASSKEKSVYHLPQQKYLLYIACSDNDKGKKERIEGHIISSQVQQPYKAEKK